MIWNTAGTKEVILTIENPVTGACASYSNTIEVNSLNGCQTFGDLVATYQNPICPNPNSGSIILQGNYDYSTLCSHYTVVKDNNVLVLDTLIDNLYQYPLNGLGEGDYTIVTFDELSGCYAQEFLSLTMQSPLDLTATVAHNYSANENECTGGISLSVAGGALPYGYAWNVGNTTPTITNLCGGIYTVTVTDDHACSTSSSYVVNANYIININESQCNCALLILGNPVTDQIQATARITTSSNTPPNSQAQVLLELYNTMGTKVATLYSGALPIPSDHNNVYSTSNLAPGLYYLRLRACGATKTKPIVIM